MARARNIKPGFFSNDQLAECDLFARLLFIGLWTIADRAGRLEDRPKRIKGQLFPYDNLDCEAMLEQLAEHGFITRYQVNNEAFIQVVNWDKHQNPHVKEQASTIPQQHEALSIPVQVSVEHSASTIQTPDIPGSCPADSLIPDSLIPDSLKNHTAQSVDCRIEPLLAKAKQKRRPAAEQEDFVLPDWVPADAWNAWLAVRKTKKAPNTAHALNLCVSTLDKLCRAGENPREIIENSVMRGYTGLFAVNKNNHQQSPQLVPGQPSPSTIVAMKLIREREAHNAQ